MAVLNYAENYGQAVMHKYNELLKFTDLYNSPEASRYRWTGANTVQVPSVTVSGFVNTNRDAQTLYTRKVDNAWQTYTLTHDRTFETLVDPMDIDETNEVLTIMNITDVFNRTEKIPEMDKYMASKLFADFVAGGGTPDTTALNVTNILTEIDAHMETMDNAEVPMEGRILYVRPFVRTLLKQAEDLVRYQRVDAATGSVNRSVNRLEELTIITVPPGRMFSAYDFTLGAVPAVGADEINYMLVHPSAVLAPQKYEFVGLDTPRAGTQGKFFYNERKYWDVFLIENRQDGIAFNTTVIA